MTFELSLTPDVESRLRDRARASGLTPEDYARRIVEDAVSARTTVDPSLNTPDSKPPTTVDDRLATLCEWAGSITPPRPVDDSRESIYWVRAGASEALLLDTNIMLRAAQKGHPDSAAAAASLKNMFQRGDELHNRPAGAL